MLKTKAQLARRPRLIFTGESIATTDKADLSWITVVPGQRSGQPCIRGLRVTGWDVLDMLASGMTEDEILGDYPYLEKADFPAVYAYASQAGRERLSHRSCCLMQIFRRNL